MDKPYTMIPNHILEGLAKIKLSPTQYRLIFVIWRYTFGFHREEHNLSLSFLAEATGCDRRQIQRELKELEERQIITQQIEGTHNRRIAFTFGVGETDIGNSTIGETDIGETTNSAIGETDDSLLVKLPTKKEKPKENTKEKVIYSIFEHWNSKNIIVHRKLTDTIKGNINSKLNDYSPMEIMEAIDNYAEIIESDEHYWTCKWPLGTFLTRQNGFVTFLEENNPFDNFRKTKSNSGSKKPTAQDNKSRLEAIFDELERGEGVT